jgi:hypothetical protein
MDGHRSRSAIAPFAALGAVVLLAVVVVDVVSHSSDEGAQKAKPTKSLIPSAGTSTTPSVGAPTATPRRKPRVSKPNPASCTAARGWTERARSAYENQSSWGLQAQRPPTLCP